MARGEIQATKSEELFDISDRNNVLHGRHGDCIYHIARSAFLKAKTVPKYYVTSKNISDVFTKKEDDQTSNLLEKSLEYEADTLFQIAAAQGSERAKDVLSIICEPNSYQPKSRYALSMELASEVYKQKPIDAKSAMEHIVLGWLLEDGIGCRQDYTEARELYCIAAYHGCVDGALELVRIGQGIRPGDYISSKNIDAIFMASRSGDVLAKFTYGQMFLYGTMSFWRDRSYNIACLSNAAKLGHPDAQYRLALILKEEIPPSKRELESHIDNLLKCAAVGGNLVEEYPATLESQSDSSQEDENDARKENKPQDWFSDSSDPDMDGEVHKIDITMNGMSGEKIEITKLNSGEGTVSNTEESIPADMTVSNSEDERYAKVRSATAHYYGIGAEQKLTRAAELFQESADCGNAEAMWMLGRCYKLGYGVRRSQTTAVDWYNRSADAGSAIGKIYLANAYYPNLNQDGNLEFAEQIYEEVLPILRKDAEEGNAYAMYMLGRCFCHGYGVHQNIDLAEEYFQKSDQAGCTEGTFWRGSMLLRTRYDKKTNREKGFFYVQKAADAGHLEALKKVSNCYKKGHGVEFNPDKARETKKKYLATLLS